MAQKVGEAQAPSFIEPPAQNRRRALQLLGSLAAAAGAAAMAADRPDPVSANTASYSDTQSGSVLSATNSGTGAAISGTNNVGSPINGSPGVVGESFNGIGVYGISLDNAYGGVFGQNNASGPGVYGTSSSGPGVQGTSSSTSYGVYGQNTASGPGVYGTSSSGYGVQGQGSALAAIFGDNSGGGTGVVGRNGGILEVLANSGVTGCAAGTNSVGVAGLGTGTNSYGVYGETDLGIGVQGSTNSTNAGVEGLNSGSGPGVHGQNLGGSGGIGVRGDSTSSSNNSPGVWGQNTGGGPAIVGYSPSGDGFSAVTTTGTGCFGGAGGGGTGVYAFSSGGTGLLAQTLGSGQNAGVFVGSVFVTGSLTVGGAKSAAVKGADGSLRRLYSLESPESWFEDFGSGQLSGGNATVELEPGFAGVVKTDQYHVYLTPEGESKGWLYVSKKSPGGFTVQEAAGGTSNIGFSYRIVAKRKDIAGARLEHVEDVPVPAAPAFPTPADTSPAPVPPRRMQP
jgi:hypothetical protein